MIRSWGPSAHIITSFLEKVQKCHRFGDQDIQRTVTWLHSDQKLPLISLGCCMIDDKIWSRMFGVRNISIVWKPHESHSTKRLFSKHWISHWAKKQSHWWVTCCELDLAWFCSWYQMISNYRSTVHQNMFWGYLWISPQAVNKWENN